MGTALKGWPTKIAFHLRAPYTWSMMLQKQANFLESKYLYSPFPYWD